MTRLSSQPVQKDLSPAENLGTTLNAVAFIEGSHTGEWALPELSQWLQSNTTALTYIQGVTEEESGKWTNVVPDAFSKTFAEANTKLKRLLHQLQTEHETTLKEAGFTLPPVSSDERLIEITEAHCQKLLKQLEQNPPDLLVIGANLDKKDRENRILSSFTTYLALHAPCSVLILKRPLHEPDQGQDVKNDGSSTEKEKPLSVMFATDGTAASTQAAQKLPQLLNTQSFAVTLVTVSHPLHTEVPFLAPYMNVTGMEEAYKENAQLLLNAAQEGLEGEGIHVKDTRAVSGSAAWELLAQAESLNPDLVVVGSHNRSGFPAWLLGSVSNRLVQSDPHSILVVR